MSAIHFFSQCNHRLPDELLLKSELRDVISAGNLAGKYKFPLYLMRGGGLTRKEYDDLKEFAQYITALQNQLAESGTVGICT